MKTYTDETIAKVRDALIESRDDVCECLNQIMPNAGFERYDRRISAYQDQLIKHDEALALLDNPVVQEPVAYLVRDPVMGRAIYFDVEIAKKYQDDPIPLYSIPQETKT